MSNISVTVSAHPDGASICFQKDDLTIASLKEAFPRARFDRGARHWTVPGKTAVARVQKWASRLSEDRATRAPTGQEVLDARKAAGKPLTSLDMPCSALHPCWRRSLPATCA